METTFTRLSALDSFFLASESDRAPMHIGAVCLFDDPKPGARALTLRRLRDHVESRLPLIPRYRQCLTYVPLEGHPVWVDCADFRIADHVRAVALPAPASPGQFEETVSWILSQPLGRTKPMWEIWLVEGLPQGGFALVCKTHHCLADGLAGAALLCAILGTDPFTVREAPARWEPRPMPTPGELLSSALEARLLGAASLARDTASSLMASPGRAVSAAVDLLSAFGSLAGAALEPPARTPFDSCGGSERRFLWWSISLDDMKRIGRRLGGTVNDVALAMVSDAFAQLAETESEGRGLRVYCPVGATASPASVSTLGNRVSGMLVDLPLEAVDMQDRWEQVVRASRACKQSGTVQGTSMLSALADSLSPALLSRIDSLLGGSSLFNLILTNVPGPQMPLFLFQHRMTAVCPLVPLFHGQGIGLAIFSYDGCMTWGMNVDAGRVDAARRLRSALAAAAVRLAVLANETVTASRSTAAAVPLRHAQSSAALAEEEAVSAAG